MNRPPRSKDYSKIRAKVQEAALLIAEGVSENLAAKRVKLSRTSLNRYLVSGFLPDGLPIWPIEPPKQCHLPTGTGAADSGLPFERLPLGCPGGGQAESTAADAEEPESRPAQRDSEGRFLPGNSEGSKWTSNARRAKKILMDACPDVAQKMVHIFNTLPDYRPDLILAFGKEILDRGLGKPVQSMEIREESVSAEYLYFQGVIQNGDETTIRRMQELACSMEEYARNNGGAPGQGEVAIIPPPGGTFDIVVPGCGREVSAPDNQHAPSAREE